jgi:hypothetical protein
MLNPTKFQEMMVDIVETLNLLDKEFTTAFYNPSTHLVYHLMGEIAKCDSIQTWAMFVIERYLKVLKGYVY